jgi:hypothetical protein
MTRDEKRFQNIEWAAIAVLVMSAALLVWLLAGAVIDITS